MRLSIQKLRFGGVQVEARASWRSLVAGLRQARKQDSAQAAVESALSLIVTLLLAFVIIEGAMLIYAYAVLNDAAREGVRYAVVHGNDSSNCSGPSTGCSDMNGGNVVSVVQQYAAVSFHDVSGMKVAVAYPDGTAQPLSLVTVTVTYPYIALSNLLPISTTLTLTSEGRIVF